MPASARPRHRVAVIGGGFGGLFATRALKGADVDVTLIDRTNHHLFQPLLYQLATGILSEGDIAPPIRDILRRQRNAEVLLGDVVDVDPEARTVEVVDPLGGRTVVEYDSLIVAAGASQSYFGHDEFAADAPGMKSIDDALELRGRIFGAFELAEKEPDPAKRAQWLTFVVVGGGPTGVEMAGQIAELSYRSLQHNFRVINPRDARVVLLDAAPKLLGSFPERLQRKSEKALAARGVEVHLGAAVTGVDPYGIDTSSEDPKLKRIESRTKIWAAGVQGAPIGRVVAEAAGASVDRAGRVEVEPDCSLPGHPEIFVVGDLMALDQLPGVAQVAIQSGQHVAQLIERRARGEVLPEAVAKPFKYKDKGSMATISRYQAIAVVGKLQFAGFIGWLAWLVVHLIALTGFKNRVAALFNWGIAFLGRGRPQRAITDRQVFEALRADRQVRDGDVPVSAPGERITGEFAGRG